MTRQELIDYIDTQIYPNLNNEVGAQMVREALYAMIDYLGPAATRSVGSVALNDDGLVTGDAVYRYVDSRVTTLLKWIGVSTTPITDGGTEIPTIGGVQVTPKKADVVLYDGKEFVWTGTAWEQLGDETSWALKTITISAGTGLSGGGDLTQNRTLSIAQEYLTKIDNGATAYSWGDHASAGYVVKSTLAGKGSASLPVYFDANGDAQTITSLVVSGNITSSNGALNITGLSTLAGGVKLTTTKRIWFGDVYYLELDANGRLHTNADLYSDKQVSAGGYSGGTAPSGIDLAAMWASLTNSIADAYASTKIAAAHIPDMATTYGYATQSWVANQGYATTASLGSFAYKNSLSTSDIPDLSGTYLPLTAGPTKPLTGGLYIYDSASKNSGIGLWNDTENGVRRSLIVLDPTITGSPGEGGDYFYIACKADGRTYLTGPAYTGTGIVNNNIVFSSQNGCFTFGPNKNSEQSTYKVGVVGSFNATTIYQNGVALGSNAFSSTAYLPLTGGQVTGWITHFSEVGDYYKIARKQSSGGGWAYEPIQFTGNDDVDFFHIGALGEGTSFIYGYIGCNAYNGLNLRISESAITWGTNAIWHAGNSNKSDVAWEASTLTLHGDLQTEATKAIYYSYNGNLINALWFYHNGDIYLGYGTGTSGYNTHIDGYNIAFRTGSGLANEVLNLYPNGDVKIGAAVTGYGQCLNIGKLSAWFYNAYFGGGSASAGPSAGYLYDGTIGLCTAGNNYGLYAWTNYSTGQSNMQSGRADGISTVMYSLCLNPMGGNVGVNTFSPNYAFDVAGVIHASTEIRTDGNVTATGQVTGGRASDARLKDNVQTMNAKEARRIIMDSRPVTFLWNKHAKELHPDLVGTDVGMIAQEARYVLPQAVSSIWENYYRITYEKYVSPIVCLLQDHERRIVELEKRLN